MCSTGSILVNSSTHRCAQFFDVICNEHGQTTRYLSAQGRVFSSQAPGDKLDLLGCRGWVMQMEVNHILYKDDQRCTKCKPVV